MAHLRKNRFHIIGLMDAIYELRMQAVLIKAARDLLSGDCGIPMSKDEYLEHGLYLLGLYETESKAVLEEIKNIYEELQKLNS